MERVSVGRLGGTVMQMTQECPQCGLNGRCRRRDFSSQAWTVLVAWGEVQHQSVDQPICEQCYSDLRDILIDRADEIAAAIANPELLQPVAEKPAAAKKVSASAAKAKKPAARAKKSSKVA